MSRSSDLEMTEKQLRDMSAEQIDQARYLFNSYVLENRIYIYNTNKIWPAYLAGWNAARSIPLPALPGLTEEAVEDMARVVEEILVDDEYYKFKSCLKFALDKLRTQQPPPQELSVCPHCAEEKPTPHVLVDKDEPYCDECWDKVLDSVAQYFEQPPQGSEPGEEYIRRGLILIARDIRDQANRYVRSKLQNDADELDSMLLMLNMPNESLIEKAKSIGKKSSPTVPAPAVTQPKCPNCNDTGWCMEQCCDLKDMERGVPCDCKSNPAVPPVTSEEFVSLNDDERIAADGLQQVVVLLRNRLADDGVLKHSAYINMADEANSNYVAAKLPRKEWTSEGLKRLAADVVPPSAPVTSELSQSDIAVIRNIDDVYQTPECLDAIDAAAPPPVTQDADADYLESLAKVFDAKLKYGDYSDPETAKILFGGRAENCRRIAARLRTTDADKVDEPDESPDLKAFLDGLIGMFPKGSCWNETPLELVTALIDERDELLASTTDAARLADVLSEIQKRLRDADDERLAETVEARDDAEKWKSQGDMYGWNFHQGRSAGTIGASFGYNRVERWVKEQLAALAAYREPRNKE